MISEIWSQDVYTSSKHIHAVAGIASPVIRSFRRHQDSDRNDAAGNLGSMIGSKCTFRSQTQKRSRFIHSAETHPAPLVRMTTSQSTETEALSEKYEQAYRRKNGCQGCF